MAPARQLPLEQACPDDPSVLDETHLYRRIHPTHFVRDENTNEVRPSSAAFTNSRDGKPDVNSVKRYSGDSWKTAIKRIGSLSGLCVSEVSREPTKDLGSNSV